MTEKDMEFKWYENIVELDDNGEIVGHGTDEDYCRYFTQVQNGEGYYDKWGQYVSFNKRGLDDDG